MQSKTISEWLNELPKGYRERALKNQTNKSEITHDSLHEALALAFLFDDTKEGPDFWQQVCQHFDPYWKRDLPELPNTESHD